MSSGPRRRPGALSREVARILRARIAMRRMSQRQVAEQTGLSTSQVSRYFKAAVALNLDEFQDICDAIGIHPELILSEAIQAIRWRERNGVDDENVLPDDFGMPPSIDPRW